MATDSFEATSLRGEPLAAPTFPDDIRVRLEARLMEARTAYARQPDDADALLLFNDGLYLNAHSVDFPGGHVRGQLGANK